MRSKAHAEPDLAPLVPRDGNDERRLALPVESELRFVALAGGDHEPVHRPNVLVAEAERPVADGLLLYLSAQAAASSSGRTPDGGDCTRLGTVHHMGSRVPERARTVPGAGEGHLGLVLHLVVRPARVRRRQRAARGPVILAANHLSMLDVPLLVVACPRPVTFMAKRGLFGDRFRTWFFHGFGGFPVRPGTTDGAALRTGLSVLASGDLLGMFAEGTRSRDRPDGAVPARRGLALAALGGADRSLRDHGTRPRERFGLAALAPAAPGPDRLRAADAVRARTGWAAARPSPRSPNPSVRPSRTCRIADGADRIGRPPHLPEAADLKTFRSREQPKPALSLLPW